MIPGQSVWGLWEEKSHWDGFLSVYCCYLVSIILPPQQYCHIPSSALVAVESELRQMNHRKTSEEYTYAVTLCANVLCNYGTFFSLFTSPSMSPRCEVTVWYIILQHRSQSAA